MKRLLVVFVLAVAGVVGLGFYLGWFQLASDSAGEKPNITFTVDPDKFQEDKEKAREVMSDQE
jgi:hypothetical protein